MDKRTDAGSGTDTGEDGKLIAEDVRRAAARLRENCYPRADRYYVAHSRKEADLVRPYLPPDTVIVVTQGMSVRVTIEQIEKGQGR